MSPAKGQREQRTLKTLFMSTIRKPHPPLPQPRPKNAQGSKQKKGPQPPKTSPTRKRQGQQNNRKDTYKSPKKIKHKHCQISLVDTTQDYNWMQRSNHLRVHDSG